MVVKDLVALPDTSQVFLGQGVLDPGPDRGPIFVSNFWKELTKLLKIDLRTSTAYHPQTDGLTERTNQTIEAYLRAFCSYQQDDWVDYLPLGEFAFNNHENSSTHQTPFFSTHQKESPSSRFKS